MTANGWFQIFLFLLVIFLVTKPLGIFMARVFNREKTFLDPVLRPIEKLVYRLTGVDETHEMRWTEYTIAMLLFSGASMAVLYLIERVQLWLPFNPQKFANVPPALAWGHRRFVHDEHQLAGLRRRIHDELFHADGRLGLPQLRFSRRGHRARHRGDPRHRPQGNRQARKFLGGHDALPAVAAAASSPGWCVVSGFAGSHSKSEAIHHCRIDRTADGAG